jgi:hypothetical protein
VMGAAASYPLLSASASVLTLERLFETLAQIA